MRAIGQRIAELRKERKMTQPDLASVIDTEYSYISRIERGKTNPTFTTLFRIAEALEVPLPELLE